MIASVKAIEFNIGQYKNTKITFDKEGQESSYTVFKTAPYHKLIQYDLKVGDHVDVKLEKNGKYWNIADIKKIATPERDVPAPAPERYRGGFQPQESPNKDIAIARAVALKAGVELYCAMIAAGLTKKTLKPEAAVEEVFAITKRFEGYATLAEDIESLSVDTSSAKATEGGFEETPFE